MIAITMLLSLTVGHAKIKNPKIETVKIYGNCEMCQKTIEKAGSLKNVAQTNWDIDTKTATITYDAKKTNSDEILKRIALSGYDSNKFLAPDSAYNNLPHCCQYDRIAKVPWKPVKIDAISGANKAAMDRINNAPVLENQLTPVFDSYFAIKDALVKTDGTTASTKATELLTAINGVKMETLNMEVHMVWMKILKGLTADIKKMAETQDIQKQREAFKTVSKNMYELLKASKPTEAVYYQYCPMQDANWLSKENSIKNPYYGSQMLSCGKTIETIK